MDEQKTAAQLPPPTSTSEPPRIDELIVRTQNFITTTIAQTVRQPIDEVGKLVARRAVFLVFGAVLLACSAGFLLFGLLSLLTQYMPLFLACLVVGAVALLGGLLVIRGGSA